VADPHKISRLQEKAIASLLETPTLEEAASRVPVGVRTLHRWRQDPQFAMAYRQARGRLVEDAVAILQRLGREAAETLRRNLRRGPLAARTRAAVAILNFVFRGTEVVDAIARLEAIEKSLEAAKCPSTHDDSLGRNGAPKVSPPTRPFLPTG
jgi:multidrug efflux pump subunit AcrA (membrane-fusion protein)